MHNLAAVLADVLERREPACLVTVANVRGSAPREPGAWMLVTATDTLGSIGGGQLEYQCIRLAAERVRALPPLLDNTSRKFPLGSNCGQCCGGVVDVEFETVTAKTVTAAQAQHDSSLLFDLAIFGAGHVGSAVVATLAELPCRVRWLDSRRAIFPEAAPGNVDMRRLNTPAQEVLAMPAGSYYLVMTHSHALDLEICDQVLRRQDAAYCGLIGSLSKRRRFERLLRKHGVTETMLEELTCPIGVSGIPGKRPQEIAIAVAAELLQIQAAVAKHAEHFPTNIAHAL